MMKETHTHEVPWMLFLGGPVALDVDVIADTAAADNSLDMVANCDDSVDGHIQPWFI
ncbi:hypothetical protein ACROAE_04655 [Shewanella sp. MF05960]|uniref:hypothetical protein n=1 Tax=Shewanella sp. MF05960 TaxID=3434874 RepID=UPI003D79FAF3